MGCLRFRAPALNALAAVASTVTLTLCYSYATTPTVLALALAALASLLQVNIPVFTDGGGRPCYLVIGDVAAAAINICSVEVLSMPLLLSLLFVLLMSLKMSGL